MIGRKRSRAHWVNAFSRFHGAADNRHARNLGADFADAATNGPTEFPQGNRRLQFIRAR